MKIKAIRQITVAVLGLFAGATPLQAQWVKTSGPDSVRAFLVGFQASVLVGTQGGVFRSVDNGNTWTALNAGLTHRSVQALANIRDTLFAGTEGGGIFRSWDGGANWTAANTGLTNLNVRTLYHYGSDLFVGTEGGGVFRSANRGGNWNAVGLDSSSAAVNALYFHSSALYAGTQGAGIFRSYDNGVNWSAFSGGLASLNVRAFIWDASWLHTGTDSGVYKLPYFSPAWERESLGAGSPPAIRAIASSFVAADIPVYLFAGTKGKGVFVSDHGIGWSDFNTGLAEMDVQAIVLSGNSHVFAGTDGGVWRRPLSEAPQYTSVRGRPSVARMDMSVAEHGAVSFSLPAPTLVSLRLFDPRGKQVSVLFEGELPAGRHTYLVKTAGLKNGVYFYRLETANATDETRKAVLWR